MKHTKSEDSKLTNVSQRIEKRKEIKYTSKKKPQKECVQYIQVLLQQLRLEGQSNEYNYLAI